MRLDTPLMDPDALTRRHREPGRATIAGFQSAAISAERSPLQAAVVYVATLPDVDTAVVADGRQLAEILAAASTPARPSEWYTSSALDDARILDPSRWPL
jgi:hypothetical protein